MSLHTADFLLSFSKSHTICADMLVIVIPIQVSVQVGIIMSLLGGSSDILAGIVELSSQVVDCVIEIGILDLELSNHL